MQNLMSNLHRIPSEWKSQRRWLGWYYENHIDVDTGEVTTKKPPLRPDGSGRADVTNPAHWGTWDEVMWGFKHGPLHGIGFALSEGDDNTGIDLDHCRDPQTGDIQFWARSILADFQTYAEVSPSGTGVHIYLKGQRPEGSGNRVGNVEIYDRARYLTVTGLALNDWGVCECQDALNGLCRELWPAVKLEPDAGVQRESLQHRAQRLEDDALLKKMLRRPNVARLFRGDFTGYKCPSEGDAALLAHLAWWTNGDAEQMDRLFRRSGLYRTKWERRTYRERSIAAAIALQGGRGYSGRVAKSVSGPKAKVPSRH